MWGCRDEKSWNWTNKVHLMYVCVLITLLCLGQRIYPKQNPLYFRKKQLTSLKMASSLVQLSYIPLGWILKTTFLTISRMSFSNASSSLIFGGFFPDLNPKFSFVSLNGSFFKNNHNDNLFSFVMIWLPVDS